MWGGVSDVPATVRERRVIEFVCAPVPQEIPVRFPSPFDRGAVHQLARRAALEMLDDLRRYAPATWNLDQPAGGKMFGVLVVADSDGTVGYVRGFSGMLGGVWEVPGWVPPVFDVSAHDALRIAAAAKTESLRRERIELTQRNVSTTELAMFDRESLDRANVLLHGIQRTYRFANARGATATLRELFAPAMPPGGAGDCAAPKLLAHAYRNGLKPLALAEVWWGALPRSGDRRAGSFYPACRGKCLPILTHMLDGLNAEPATAYGVTHVDASHPAVVHEDQWIAIVEKPCGLLSVPGRSAQLHDSVLTRLRERYPEATGPLLVHRLDLDTSGLLLVGKDTDTFAALQRLFASREIEKRYIARLDGNVRSKRGIIELPLRVDVDDRPRQMHDPVHGKRAVTEWMTLGREDGRTRVAFRPLTGRTHQLRVHASHPDGLDAPIIGDRLYGRQAPADDERLMLHAERLAFVHPVTGERVEVASPAPF